MKLSVSEVYDDYLLCKASDKPFYVTITIIGTERLRLRTAKITGGPYIHPTADVYIDNPSPRHLMMYLHIALRRHYKEHAP